MKARIANILTGTWARYRDIAPHVADISSNINIYIFLYWIFDQFSDKVGPEDVANGSGSNNYATCTQNLPRRPILRPFRDKFVFLAIFGPRIKQYKHRSKCQILIGHAIIRSYIYNSRNNGNSCHDDDQLDLEHPRTTCWRDTGRLSQMRSPPNSVLLQHFSETYDCLQNPLYSDLAALLKTRMADFRCRFFRTGRASKSTSEIGPPSFHSALSTEFLQTAIYLCQ